MAGLDTSNLSGVTCEVGGFADSFRSLVEAVSPLWVCLVTVLYSGEGASVLAIGVGLDPGAGSWWSDCSPATLGTGEVVVADGGWWPKVEDGASWVSSGWLCREGAASLSVGAGPSKRIVGKRVGEEDSVGVVPTRGLSSSGFTSVFQQRRHL